VLDDVYRTKTSFHRLSPIAVMHTSGTGLGLSLGHEIAMDEEDDLPPLPGVRRTIRGLSGLTYRMVFQPDILDWRYIWIAWRLHWRFLFHAIATGRF
jgi:hypothetical protein